MRLSDQNAPRRRSSHCDRVAADLGAAGIRQLPLALLLGGCWAATNAAWAQSSGPAFSVVPTFSLSQTLTDNRKLSTTDRQADLITTISPGVQISSRSGAVQGSLSYTAGGVIYARDTAASNFQNQLAANGSAELIDRRLSLSATASVGQQTVSPFGTQSTSLALDNGNRAEVYSYSLSPLLHGRLLGAVDYQARIAYSSTGVTSGTSGGSTALNGSFGLSGAFGRFGWTADASRGYSDFDGGRRSFNSRAGGSLSMAPDYDLRFILRLAQESSNVVSAQGASNISWGGSATWTPTPRTTFNLEGDRRYFGNSHSITLQHRFARSSWAYTDSRSAVASTALSAANFSLYDIFFAQAASTEPDPVKRDLFVRDFLRKNGLDAGTTVVGGFLTSTNTLQRRQNLSVSFQGLRETLTLAAYQTSSSTLDGSGLGGSLGTATQVKQFGYNVAASYRLTPTDSLSLLGAVQRTPEVGQNAGNELRTLSATWQGTLGRRTQATFGLRYAVFDSETNPYHETALIGSLSLRF